MTMSSAPQKQTNTFLGRGIFFMLLAMCLFSVLNAVIKGTISQYHPIQLTFFRCFVAVVPPALFLAFRGVKWSLPPSSSWPTHLKRSLLLALGYPLIYIGIVQLSLSTSTALYFSATFFIVMLSYPLLKEKISFRQWAAVIIGFFGVLIIIQPGSDTFQWAMLFMVGGAFAESAFNLYGRLLSSTHDNVMLTLLGALLPALLIFPFLPYVWITPDMGGWIALLALGLIGGVGQLCVTYAYSLAPAGTLAPMIYSSILWSGLFDIILYEIWPTTSLLIGCGIIIMSGLMVISTGKRTSTPA